MFNMNRKQPIRRWGVLMTLLLIPSLGQAEDEVRLYQEPPSSTEVLYRLKGMKFRGAEAKAVTYRAIKFAPAPDAPAVEEPAPAMETNAPPPPATEASPPPPPVLEADAPASPPAPQVAVAAPVAPPHPATSAHPARKGEILAFPAIFDTGKWELTDGMKPYANAIGEAMQKDPKLKLNISGHTDAQGGDIINIPLSQKRAQSVKEYLASQFQIDPSRIMTSGYASHQPINPENPMAPENRRVQIQPVL